MHVGDFYTHPSLAFQSKAGKLQTHLIIQNSLQKDLTTLQKKHSRYEEGVNLDFFCSFAYFDASYCHLLSSTVS